MLSRSGSLMAFQGAILIWWRARVDQSEHPEIIWLCVKIKGTMVTRRGCQSKSCNEMKVHLWRLLRIYCAFLLATRQTVTNESFHFFCHPCQYSQWTVLRQSDTHIRLPPFWDTATPTSVFNRFETSETYFGGKNTLLCDWCGLGRQLVWLATLVTDVD